MSDKKDILVYVYWDSFKISVLMGIFLVMLVRGKEVFFFEYIKEWLKLDFIYMIDFDL